LTLTENPEHANAKFKLLKYVVKIAGGTEALMPLFCYWMRPVNCLRVKQLTSKLGLFVRAAEKINTEGRL